jgi:hypothetical protein
MFNGQAEQDKFVTNILKEKRNGYFVEIGSNHPININNSYILETKYNWKGIMVEYDQGYLPLYIQHRPNSIHLINDARNIDYADIFKINNVPHNVDYLQIDLEASNGSTIQTLEKFNSTVFNQYKFATVTFEHDIYEGNFFNTRERSREIFKNQGYVRVFDDIHNKEPKYVYEDWYVYPDLVDMNYVNTCIQNNSSKYVSNNITGVSIDWRDIIY